MMDLLEEGNGAPFSIICRTCLKAKQGMKSVYTATIPDMLMYCVSLKVEHGDGLPNLICPQCLKQINQLFSFKQLCEKSESLLKQYLPLKIIPAQDLTVEDVTQNQILDTLEDPTLTSTSIITNESLSEPFEEHDLVETDNLIPLAICLPQYGDNSLFTHEEELESERNLYILRDDDFVNSYLDATDSSWADNTEMPVEILVDNANIIPIIDIVDDKPSFPCDKCKEVLTCSEDLAVHMSMHTPGGALTCNVCNKDFHRKESLKRHIKRHMKDKQICCNMCDKKFSDRCDLRRHLKRHVDWKEKPHVCTECGKAYTDAQNLTVHMRVHTGQKPFSCQLCPSTFTDRRALKAHYDTHSTERKYRCNECGKSFKSATVLSEHSRIHTGYKPYKCDICGKDFSQAVNLQHHLASHNPERSFECRLCNNHSYKRISSLKDHMAKAHPDTEEANRTRTCNVCNKVFQKFSELAAHRSQHKKVLYKCHVCNKTFPQKYRRKRHMLCHMKKGEIKEVNGNYILEEDGQVVSNSKERESSDGSSDITQRSVSVDDNTEEGDTSVKVNGEFMEQNAEKSAGEIQYTTLQSATTKVPATTDEVYQEYPQPLEPECTLEENILSPIDEAILNKSYKNDSTTVLLTSPHQMSHTSGSSNVVFNKQTTWVQQETGEVVVAHNPIIQFDGYTDNALPVIQLTDIYANGLRDKDGNYECKICKIKVLKYKDLSVHMSLHPVNTSVWECNVCEKRFSKKTFLSRHVKIHMTREMFPCAHCDKKFYEKSKLRKHIIKFHPEVSETPPASSEEEKSQTSIDNSHPAMDLTQSTTNYSHTLLLDRSQSTLDQTHSSLDLSLNNSYDSASNSMLRNSISSSSYPVNFNPYVVCARIMTDGCQLVTNPSQTTIDNSQLMSNDVHDRLDSIPEEQYSCDVCGKSYSKAIKLSLHMRTHNQSQELEPAYTCQVCQQTLLTASDLTRHSQTHLDDGNTATHSCQTCGQHFSLATDLAAHMKSIHNTPTKAVPICKICGKSFTSMYKRRKHMQTHKMEANNSEVVVVN